MALVLLTCEKNNTMHLYRNGYSEDALAYEMLAGGINVRRVDTVNGL